MRSTLAEQFAPVLRVHAQLRAECTPTFDLKRARKRLADGYVALDARGVFQSCGDLRPAFDRVLSAFEIGGFVSNEDSRSLRAPGVDLHDLVGAWLLGDGVPRDTRRHAARQAAIVLANAVLGTASARLKSQDGWSHWKRSVCPCCGGSPDIALTSAKDGRVLICARCDAHWASAREKCLGCDSDEIVRINAESMDYDVLICNVCGRFLMERDAAGLESLIIERAITAELAIAAEQRGLRP